jgi:triosephosphate isomerase
MTTIRPLVAGNWKMNGLRASLAEALAVADGLGARPAAADVLICPPATLIASMAAALSGRGVAVGAQDCRAEASGAFTGDLSAEMLRDAGASAVIVGHSERRTLHGERDEEVKAKAAAALRAGLTAIVCVGETAGERKAGLTLEVVSRQLRGSLPPGGDQTRVTVAYEPVWAIGTGLTPTLADVADVHLAIRRLLEGLPGMGSARILYGGSVKPQNARELMAVGNVNGALVGGASLKAADFLGIVSAYA